MQGRYWSKIFHHILKHSYAAQITEPGLQGQRHLQTFCGDSATFSRSLLLHMMARVRGTSFKISENLA